MHLGLYLYALLAAVVAFSCLGAIGEARVAPDPAARRRWHLVALAAVLAQPAFVYFGVSFLARALVRETTQDGGELYWSGELGPWIIAIQAVVMVASTALLALSAGRFESRWDRVFTRIDVATALPGLGLFLLASTSGLLEPATVCVSKEHGLRFVYYCEDTTSIQRVEWPAMFPILAEEVRQDAGSWLNECPSRPGVDFSNGGRVEVRDGDGVLWMTYIPADTGFLPGAGGSFEDLRWTRPQSSISTAAPAYGHP